MAQYLHSHPAVIRCLGLLVSEGCQDIILRFIYQYQLYFANEHPQLTHNLYLQLPLYLINSCLTSSISLPERIDQATRASIMAAVLTLLIQLLLDRLRQRLA